MKSKQVTLCEVECSCGEALNLWISGEELENCVHCLCGKSFIIKIMDTSLWTPSCIEYTIMIAEED